MSPPACVQLFYNPGAGSFSQSALDRLIAAFHSEGADTVLTPSVDSTPQILPHATHICIAGGDGTIRHVVAMMIASGTTLPVAICPTGTINLLARELCPNPAPREEQPRTLARALLCAPPRQQLYPVTAVDTVFLACASIGPDSVAVAGLSPRLKRQIGRLAYLAAFGAVLMHWRRPRITLHADGAAHPCEAVYIAKGRYYAGPWSFAPDARLGDPLLHVVALRRARRRDFARFLLALVLRRDPARDTNVIHFTTTQLTIAADHGQNLPLQADGDIVGQTPLRLEVRPRPLWLS